MSRSAASCAEGEININIKKLYNSNNTREYAKEIELDCTYGVHWMIMMIIILRKLALLPGSVARHGAEKIKTAKQAELVRRVRSTSRLEISYVS